MAASVRSAEYNRFLQYDSANSQRIELWHILITQRLVRQHPEMMSPSIPPSSSSNQGMPIPTQTSTPFSGHRVTKTQTQAFSSYEGAYSGILCPACLRENKRIPLDMCQNQTHPH